MRTVRILIRMFRNFEFFERGRFCSKIHEIQVSSQKVLHNCRYNLSTVKPLLSYLMLGHEDISSTNPGPERARVSQLSHSRYLFSTSHQSTGRDAVR